MALEIGKNKDNHIWYGASKVKVLSQKYAIISMDACFAIS